MIGFFHCIGGRHNSAHLNAFPLRSVLPPPADHDAVLPLVVGQGQGPDSSVAARIGKELLEVRHLPEHDHTTVSSCEQVLPVAAQLDGL